MYTPEVPIDAKLAERAESIAAHRGENVDTVIERALREYVGEPMAETKQSKTSIIVMSVVAGAVLVGSLLVLGYGVTHGDTPRCEGTIMTDSGCWR